ncbi:hypothetical protein [Flagellimonas lutaonensis]|uniref:Uncharacterized protein n=1 Tax=Flagellimonas lutaonensis TaxID=516051 RepID=A0A0D5YQE5_9FLAO|nr:hypothetical protein [Allomuricauda lutaonensis]AKA34502.1 hypothetical protein VC82_843 [Allomuricauda lutaonensis]
MGSTKVEEVPHIVEVLENITGKSTRASKSLSYKKAVIDMNIIKWIKESTTGNKNYTFPIFVDGASDDEFYNLIVPVDENGNVLSPKIRRYVVAPHALEAYRGSGYDFAKFQGKYYTYNFDRFFNAINFKSGKLAMGMPDCNEDGSAIGSTSSSPIENPDLIQTDWHQLWGPSTDIPTGSISFSSLWESYTAYQAGAYQNTGSSSQYEETVSTSAQGIVWLGNNNPTAPTVTHHLYSATTFNITANHAPDGNAFSLGPDICTTRINIVIKWSDGTTTTFEYYTNCEATAPISKRDISNIGSKSGCDNGPGQTVTINLNHFSSIVNRLCPDIASEAYTDMFTNPAHAQALSDYLIQNNVQCEDASFEKAFALEAMIAMSQDAEVDFDDQIILDKSVLSNQKVKCVYDKLKSQSNTFFKNVINTRFASDKIANIRFKIAQTPGGEDAFTKGSANGTTFRLYDILLDPEAVASASNIEIALMLIHESIHAELLDRLVEMGAITGFDSDGYPIFISNNVIYNSYIGLTALMINLYKNYAQSNPQWNHNSFNTTGLRDEMVQNLMSLHPLLNDSNNDFLSNVNGQNNLLYNNFTLQELMEFIGWIGLEETDEYKNTIGNNAYLQGKKEFVENAAKTEYTKNCN